MKVVLFDIETDGLLHQMTRVHCLCLRVIEDDVHGDVQSFNGDRIQQGLDILSNADVVVGHNIISFDIPALELIYPEWHLPDNVIIRDTLVLTRMVFADEKDRDFRRYERGEIEGKLIGLHNLEAWGQRLGLMKGDYKKIKEAEAKEKGITAPEEMRIYVWGSWSQQMEDYCVQDVEVTTGIWDRVNAHQWAETAVRLEHRIHHVMHLQQEFGFQFDTEQAETLHAEVQIEYDRLCDETTNHFGKWMAPKKLWKGEPRAEFGEDKSRKHWGEVEVCKKTLRYKDKMRGDRIAGDMFCPVVVKEFNPRSRPMIIDRLTKIYQWEPVDFTEKGNPSLDDDVLRNLAQHIPICENLAEIFFLNKLLGALANGDNAWLTSTGPDNRMHGYVNVGGTVTGRASHLGPNMAQVPKVKVVDVKNPDGTFYKKILGPDGNPISDCFDDQGTLKKKIILKGRLGNYGWECRSLFTAPPGWYLMGADLAGLELRCFGARLHQYDSGAYLQVVLNGDPHTENMTAAGLASRDQAKTFIYATLYGGGDEKIGSIVLPPSATAGEMKARGRQLKSNFEQAIPAYRSLIRSIAAQAQRGFLIGLDGRKLYVRSKHAALNMQLQSDGALLAKTWVLFFFDMMNEAGYEWSADWGLCAWVHDEIQAACRTKDIAEHARRIAVEAAIEAGLYYEYPAPIEAGGKIGFRWSSTH